MTTSSLSRRGLMAYGLVLGAGAALSPLAAQSPAPTPTPTPTPSPAPGKKAPDRGPQLDRERVREFVGAAHGDLAKTKAMLEEQPALVNATWDWGGGDWETGLGGASHVGSREIAEYLLSKGARMDIFCAAMLGRIDIVKAFLADDPKVVHLPGPHGIPLLRHAVAGKQEAVAELLRAHGAQG